MGYTHYPNGITSMGMPIVGGAHYAGMWGNDIWFVDDDNGLDTNKGDLPTAGFKTIQKAITKAGPQDTIYLKAREVGGQAYPGYSAHGYFTGTNIIPKDRQGLAIIGTGRGGGSIGMSLQCMIEPDSGTTDVGITVKSPGVSIENLGIKALAGSTGAIYANRGDGSDAQAWGLTVSNCFFKDFQTTISAKGTIHLDTIHWVTIQHCTFREAGIAINLLSQHTGIKEPIIRDCTFTGIASEWSSDIRLGDVKGIEIDNCRFLHAPPSGGDNVVGYIDVVGAAVSGLISNCYFSYAGTSLAATITLADVLVQAHCWGDDSVVTT